VEETERQLATLCAQGDRAAEKELYLKYAARIHAVCRRYAADADEASDLMQDAFIKAFDRISGFRYHGEGSLYAWLRTLTVNLALDRIRRKRWRKLQLEELPERDLPDPPDESVETIPLPAMLEMIASLPPERRLVFNLYCLEDWSHREIANRLGITEKGSAAILHQARKQMKEKINHYLAEHR
jgi:RNA polymerase sigma-70 factor (ECF subfamily)